MKHRLIVVCLVIFWLSTVITAQEVLPETTPEITPEVIDFEVPEIDALQSSIVDAYLTTDNDTPLIGETVEVTLHVEVPPNVEILLWPTFPADFEPFDVLETGAIDAVGGDDGNVLYTQVFKFAVWDTGGHLTPEIPIVFSHNDSEPIAAPVESVFFNVPSTIADVSEPMLRPSIPALDLPYLPPWIVVAVVVFVASVIWLFRRLLPERRIKQTQRIGTPTQIAIAQIEDLKRQQLPAITVYPMVADSLRQYLQERFQIGAVEMTTDELIRTLREQTPLPDTLRRSLHQLLEQADLVKFARFAPDVNTTNRLLNFAIKWLQEAGQLEFKHEETNG